MTDQDFIDTTREFVPHVMRMENVPGLNLAVALKGEIIWEEGFGYADLAKTAPMTPETVMRSGSMGKTYTATAVMQLVEFGNKVAEAFLSEARQTLPKLGDMHRTVLIAAKRDVK